MVEASVLLSVVNGCAIPVPPPNATTATSVPAPRASMRLSAASWIWARWALVMLALLSMASTSRAPGAALAARV